MSIEKRISKRLEWLAAALLAVLPLHARFAWLAIGDVPAALREADWPAIEAHYGAVVASDYFLGELIAVSRLYKLGEIP